MLTPVKTFQDFLSENLAGFGWQVAANDIPDYDTAYRALKGIVDWGHGLDDKTRGIIGASDISNGLWQSGMLSDFPALYNVFAGNEFGGFSHQFDDVIACVNRAHHQVDEQPSEVPDGGIQDVIDAENATGEEQPQNQ